MSNENQKSPIMQAIETTLGVVSPQPENFQEGLVSSVFSEVREEQQRQKAEKASETIKKLIIASQDAVDSRLRQMRATQEVYKKSVARLQELQVAIALAQETQNLWLLADVMGMVDCLCSLWDLDPKQLKKDHPDLFKVSPEKVKEILDKMKNPGSN